MCILSFKLLADGLVVVANREEDFRRPLHQPVDYGSHFIAGPDYGKRGQHKEPGSWLGMNRGGLLVALTNRDDGDHSGVTHSVGRLLVELLDNHKNPKTAARYCADQLMAHRYRPVNFILANKDRVFVVSCVDQEIKALHHFNGGLPNLETHTICNMDLDDMDDQRVTFASHRLDKVYGGLFQEATTVFSHPTIVRDIPEHQTRCSSFVVLDPDEMRFYHSHCVPLGPDSYRIVQTYENPYH